MQLARVAVLVTLLAALLLGGWAMTVHRVDVGDAENDRFLVSDTHAYHAAGGIFSCASWANDDVMMMMMMMMMMTTTMMIMMHGIAPVFFLFFSFFFSGFHSLRSRGTRSRSRTPLRPQRFTPSNLIIEVGDTIEWHCLAVRLVHCSVALSRALTSSADNCQFHTITESDGYTCNNLPESDSLFGYTNRGCEPFGGTGTQSFTFDREGVFTYHWCVGRKNR